MYYISKSKKGTRHLTGMWTIRENAVLNANKQYEKNTQYFSATIFPVLLYLLLTVNITLPKIQDRFCDL